MAADLATIFLQHSDERLADSVKTLTKCLDLLTEQQIWARGGPHENAVGNILLHLCGNLRQRIQHGVGGRPDVRIRDAEFAATGGFSRAELLQLYVSTVEETRAVIAAVSAERLGETICPQGHDVTVLAEICKVVGHLQYHVGQVVLVTKQMAATDLDLTIPRPR